MLSSENEVKSWLVPDLLINFPWGIVFQQQGKTRKIAKILKLPKAAQLSSLRPSLSG